MDYSHMEKMGRELKCPICLSLLDSAVSLSCNHVFCNLCIGKSMKSTSDCPVCKVPFRRREVRPAQHMDNLVSIYKSMEAASGVSVFVSQTVSSQKLSGRENQPEAYIFCDNGNDLSRTPDPGNKGNLKGNSSKGSSKKPSFPAKKRVQVPQHPLPETPKQPPAKDKVSLRKHTKTESLSNLAVQKDTPIFKNKENPEFCPFFWLRNEDAEKSSQPSDEDHVMDTPPIIPCFSDIKDSDDELQCDKTPEKGLPIASHTAADLFDSEIFEWTQRACSPELCSSPLKVQVEEPDRCNVAIEEDQGGSEPTDKSMESIHSKECFVSEKGTDKVVVDLVASAFPETVYICNEGKTARCNMRLKKASNNSRHKRPKRSNRICIDSMDVTKDKNSDGEVDNIIPGNVPILKGISDSTVKKVTVDSIDTQITIKNDSTLSGGEISLNHSTKPMLVDLAVPVDFTCGIRKGQNMKKSNKGHQNKRERETKAICIDPKDESEKSFQNFGHQGTASNISNLKVRSNRRVRKVCLVPSVTQSMPGYVSPCAEVAKAHNQDVSPMLVDLSGSFNDGEGYRDEQNANSTKKNNTIVGQRRSSYSRRSKPQQLTNSANTEMQHLGYNGFISDSSKSFPIGSDLKVSYLGLNGTNKVIEEILNSSGGMNLKPAKKVTFFAGDSSKGLSANSDIYDSAKATQLSINAQGDSVDSLKREKTYANLNGILRKCETNPMKFQCLFCQCKEDSEASGFMVRFHKGKPVTAGYGGSNILHAHSNCTEWAPNVYFEGDIAINLEAELTRSKRIKCSCCGLKGAALGCYEKSCHRSFHVPCAKLTPQCRWDYENFVMLCPLHTSSNLPCEISGSQRNQKAKCRPRRHTPQKVTVKHDGISSCNWNSHGLSRKIVLCCSALTLAEKATVTEFESLSKVTVLKNWDSSVTHVIASTDENGACRRTLKFLMGILEGKWILSIEWVKACLKAMENVDEQHYEISVDIHGIRDGPRNGRLRLLNKQPKLLDGYKFYFTGDFLPSYKCYLNDLVVAAGGKVLHRKPIFEDNEAPSSTYIIYSLELPDKFKSSDRNMIFDHRRTDAEAIASSCHGIVGTNSWLLNSIAACKLQKLGG